MAPFVLAGITLLLAATNASAQAWTPPRGELVVSLSYQYVNGGDHLFSDSVILGTDFGSTSIDFGTVESRVLFVNTEIGITDRLALEGGVPFISARYTGTYPHTPSGSPLEIDNGQWHSSFQDGRIGARFMALKSPKWAVTPWVSYGFPTKDYPALGHAALGRHLNELRLGAVAARMLSLGDRPAAYFQGSYSYAFMEDIEHVSLDRSDIYLEFGYFLPKFVTVQAFGNYQNVHGGIDWAGDLHTDHHDFEEFFLNHDATAATHFWRLGGGVSFPLAERVELYANVSKTLWGVNTHDAIVATVGVSWSFQAFGSLGRIGN